MKVIQIFPILAAFGLTACATPRTATVHCLTKEQYEELKKAEPDRVGSRLTGNAQEDYKIVAGSAVRLRAYSHGLLTVLGGCVG